MTGVTIINKIFTEIETKCTDFKSQATTIGRALFLRGKLPLGSKSDEKIRDKFVNFVEPYLSKLDFDKGELYTDDCQILLYSVPSTSTPANKSFLFTADLTCKHGDYSNVCFEALDLVTGKALSCSLAKGCEEVIYEDINEDILSTPVTPFNPATPFAGINSSNQSTPSQGPIPAPLTAIDGQSDYMTYGLMGIGATAAAYLVYKCVNEMHKRYDREDEAIKNPALEIAE